MSWLRNLAFVFVAVMCMAAASDPAERLDDPAQEARARELFKEVRCLVCQNESIDASESELAADLRGIVRQQVATGASDAQVRDFLTDRYGEYVLLKPQFSLANAILWLAPFAILALGGLMLAGRLRSPQAESELSKAESERLSRLTETDETRHL